MRIISRNPATEEVNKEFEPLTAEQSLEICKSVKGAFTAWRDLGIDRRTALLRNLGKVFESRKEEYARLMGIEMGRTNGQALSEIATCVKLCNYFADNSKGWLQDEEVKTEYQKSYVAFEPLGVVLAVMPWNYPFTQVIRCAAPAMVVGNTVVLRHSNMVPMCAMALEDAFREAGFPENTFRTIITEHDVVPKLVRSRYIDAVSVTSGFDAGKAMAKLAAANIKKIVLELGGSNPFVVLSDADLDLAAKKAVETRIASTGQSCSASKRFIVVREVADDFSRKVIENTKGLVVGDPLDPKTQIGPLANMEQLQKLDAQVKDAIEKGAKVECGGGRLGSRGFFYQPTVLTEVKKNMKVMTEEVFGPVIPIIRVKGEDDAIKLANGTEYGLGASVWTRDLQKGERIARIMESGMACVNRGANSDYRFPFGGIKKSGMGREFSKYSLLEFANIKAIIVA
jgi:succinate-semialdehyde dehydrogenase/glutarate-semialdehyde dehydrogenase